MNGKARGKKDGLIVVYKVDCILAARVIITREMKRHVLRDTKKKVPGRSPSTSEALQNRLLEVSLQSQILTGCISFVRPKASSSGLLDLPSATTCFWSHNNWAVGILNSC